MTVQPTLEYRAAGSDGEYAHVTDLAGAVLFDSEPQAGQ